MKTNYFYQFCQFVLPLFFMVGLALPASAAPPLQWPAACTVGEECWVVNYVDHDSGDGVADYTCGGRSYDALQGTEIALRDRAAMKKGVDVYAAADGTVLRVRDEIADQQTTAKERDDLRAAHKGCGNGIVIDHGEGWQSVYCHLKQKSIKVNDQQKIKAGTKIAQIGQSGAAEFQQLYFGLFFEGQTVDPFSGLQKEGGCGAPDHALWRDGPAYDPVSFYAGGIVNEVPDFDALKMEASGPTQLAVTSDKLVFWAGLFGAMAGDEVRMEIRDPAGRLVAERTMTQDQTRARQFYYVGRQIKGQSLLPGDYTGTIHLTRTAKDGMPLVRKMAKIVHVE